ncbi:thymidine kinase [Citricoccus alkalitolerans]|uniref:Thymidine kinase n=1 Tax=Citricoccus alkalitolerans TaxID=246603 RepID=A0ABV8XTZ0_9MICC
MKTRLPGDGDQGPRAGVVDGHTGRGRIEVITGPMFAGKTEELMRRVRRATIAGLRVLVINHALDDRRGANTVSSHAGGRISARSVSDSADLRTWVDRADLADGGSLDLVAIDEAQFFGSDLVTVAIDLADRGVTVVVSGLCLTFDDQAFEPLPALMAAAESVTKLLAVCAVCGADAAFHRRVDGHGVVRSPDADGRAPGTDMAALGTGAAVPVTAEAARAGIGKPLVAAAEHVGGAGQYQARCRLHR